MMAFLVSCAVSKGDKNTGDVKIPENEMESVGSEVCSGGQRLVVVPSERQTLSSLRPAIAFVSGDGECAISDGVSDQWYDVTGFRWFFELEVPGCVPNNSIWTLERSSSADGILTARYVDTTKTKTIRLRGNVDIGATYARDHAGIRVMACQDL